MTTELEKIYSPHEVEERWSQFWIEKGLTVAPEIPGNKKPFSIVIPPPNVTGSLHLGHALNNTLQDILVRTHRMQGDAALWVFGTDHAGIATQNVVERQLAAEDLSRHDVGREEFLKRVWKWRGESGGTITRQLKLLGASLDWSRERFTMDEGLSRAVREVFVSLYQEKLLYRDQRLINWCPRCQTALSDLEVEFQEINGHLWHIRYSIEGTAEFVTVATTRPETLLGDTAVAVNPDDERYKDLIGKTVIVPFVNRLVPIIGDSYVDSTFGSGVVKITPAHDFNDFEMGKRHSLEKINVLTPDGRMNENSAHFQNLNRQECRKQIVKELEESGQLEKIENHRTNVGHCYRCKTVVEPYLSLQWFVKTESLAKPAMEAVRSGKTRFHPAHWEKTYFSWMENIKDWCVSRQIWWGHRIPAWYCGEGHITVEREDPKKCSTCHSTEIVQDEDVLDTWFSSALWPFSTLGWPDKTELLKAYYPTNVLVTSFDIIFFWVARMMMMGLHFMKEVPFHNVYIHALIRDAQGQKMSKSKGNVIDPLHLMKEFGTDALRFTLIAFAAQGRDIKLAEDRVEGYRNFCNKVWNAARFLYSTALPLVENFKEIENTEPMQEEDEWILLELNRCIQNCTEATKEYKFNELAHSLYSFIWHHFCDWYLELIKPRLYGEGEEKIQCAKFALKIFEQALRLLHPLMPFITEELWQKLPAEKEISISQAKYPIILNSEIEKKYKKSWRVINILKETVSAIRQIRAETGIVPKQELPILYIELDSHHEMIAELQSPLLQKRILNLAKSLKLEIIHQKLAEPAAVAFIGNLNIKVYIPLTGLIDLEKEKARQKKKLEKIEKDFSLLQAKLKNDNFIQNAPEDLVEEVKTNLHQKEIEKKEIREALELLK